jgi:hypothetical protein
MTKQQKPYLLIAGEDFYPEEDTGDWIGCFFTKEEAEEKLEQLKQEKYPFNWHYIVDLREWIYV